MAVAEAIKAVVKTNNKYRTQKEIAEAMGVSRDELVNVMGKRQKPSPQFVSKFTKAFNLPDNWLLTAKHHAGGSIATFLAATNVRIPVVGSFNNEVSGNPALDVTSDGISVSAEIAQVADKIYYVGPNDECIMPMAEHGDLLAFRETTAKKRGMLHVVEIDGELVVRRLEWVDGGWWLDCVNPSYEITPINPTDKIIGLVTGVVKFRNSRRATVVDPNGFNGDPV